MDQSVKYKQYIQTLTVYDLRRELLAWRLYLQNESLLAVRILEEKIEPIEFELKRLGYEVNI